MNKKIRMGRTRLVSFVREAYGLGCQEKYKFKKITIFATRFAILTGAVWLSNWSIHYMIIVKSLLGFGYAFLCLQLGNWDLALPFSWILYELEDPCHAPSPSSSSSSSSPPFPYEDEKEEEKIIPRDINILPPPLRLPKREDWKPIDLDFVQIY